MPLATRNVPADTFGSGVRAREAVRVNVWLVIGLRYLWWLVVHPYVTLPIAGSVALGVLGRSVAVAGLSLVAGALLATLTWVGWQCVRGSARGLGPILSGLSRIIRVRRRWPGVAQAVGYGQAVEDWPSAPPLKSVRMTQHGVAAVAVTGWVVKTGAALESAAPDIAAGMFCDRVRVRPLRASYAALTFEWGAHLAQEYTLHDVPEPSINAGWPRNVAFGVTEDGGPAELVANLSTLIGGVAGSGKSSAAWAIIAGYLKAQIPIRVRVLDPGELEFASLKKALEAHSADESKPSICHQYVTETSQVGEAFEQTLRAMNARKAAMRERDDGTREHEPTEAEPLDILVIDELLPYVDKLKSAGVNHPIGQLVYIGRKYGFLVIACTQVGQADALGRVRDLFPQRICFRTKNRHMTEAVLGESAESDGARCSGIDIADRGVCYLEVPGVKGYLLARSAYVSNKETVPLAAGLLPAKPTEAAVLRERRNRKPTGLYRHYGHASDGTPVLLYVGISNRPDIREDQHEADKPWWPWVDLELSELETYPKRSLAETAELEAIAAERPVFNVIGNNGNPWRVDARKVPLGTDYQLIIDEVLRRQIEAKWRGRVPA